MMMPRTRIPTSETVTYKGVTIEQLKNTIDSEKRQFTMVYPEIVWMVGDRHISDAIVLSRIFFWYFPTDNPRKPSKLRRKLFGKLCLVKSASEMAIETGLSPRTVEKAYKRLQQQVFFASEKCISLQQKI